MTSKSLSSLCEKICLPVTGHCKCRARLMVCSDTIIIPVHVCAGPWWRRHHAGGLLQWPDGLQGQAEDQPFPLAQSAQDLLQTQQLLYQNQGIRGESEFTLFICIFELENPNPISHPPIFSPQSYHTPPIWYHGLGIVWADFYWSPNQLLDLFYVLTLNLPLEYYTGIKI